MSNLGSQNRRGQAHMALADAFSKKFPVGSVVTLQEFDFWAMESHHYGAVNPNSNDELNTARNNLRKKINNGGTAFDRNLSECFVVEVLNHGQDYEVRRANDEVDNAIHKLPSQVKSHMATKRRRIEKLVSSADYNLLPAMDQLRIEMLSEHLESVVLNVNHALGQFNREWKRAQNAIERLAATQPGLNGGIAGFIEDTSDDDENAGGQT